MFVFRLFSVLTNSRRKRQCSMEHARTHTCLKSTNQLFIHCLIKNSHIISVTVCVCARVCAKVKKGSSVRDFVTAQMSRATDGSGRHKGLMDRWFVSSLKVNRSVLLRRRAEAELPESHVSRFYWTKWASNVQLKKKMRKNRKKLVDVF